MKKRIVSIVLFIGLLIISAVPVFAADEVKIYEYGDMELPDITGVWNKQTYPYAHIEDWGYPVLYLYQSQLYDTGTKYGGGGNWVSYKLNDSQTWYFASSGSGNAGSRGCGYDKLAWASFSIEKKDGTVISFSEPKLVLPIIEYDDYQFVFENMFSQLSVTNVVQVLSFVAGAVVALVFLWWGIRKLVRALMGAFRKGKIKI